MKHRMACISVVATACLAASPSMAAPPTDHEVSASLMPPPAGWADKTFSPLRLELLATRTRVHAGERPLLSAKWCNTSKRDVLMYRNTDWDVSRGILLLRRPTSTSAYEVVYSVPHRMIPPGVANRPDSYTALEPGACRYLRLDATAASLSGGPGDYQFKLLGIPYATTRRGLPSSAWTMEGGTIESNVLDLEVLP